jgi:hypothetical protein
MDIWKIELKGELYFLREEERLPWEDGDCFYKTLKNALSDNRSELYGYIMGNNIAVRGFSKLGTIHKLEKLKEYSTVKKQEKKKTKPEDERYVVHGGRNPFGMYQMPTFNNGLIASMIANPEIDTDTIAVTDNSLNPITVTASNINRIISSTSDTITVSSQTQEQEDRAQENQLRIMRSYLDNFNRGRI